MARLSQLEVGGIYHVFNRGVEKRIIFKKQQDYARFVLGLYFFNDKNPRLDIWSGLHQNKKFTLSILGRSERPRMEDKRERIVDLLAFALMPNHLHFILREIRPGGISLFMQKMGGYTQYFNQQYDRVGPLFQGRYKSVRIKNNIQLANIFNYVHTNPVELNDPGWKDFTVKNKHNAIRLLEDNRWSSYPDYIGQKNFPHVTQRNFFIDYFGGAKGCQKSVEDWISFKAENAALDKFLGI